MKLTEIKASKIEELNGFKTKQEQILKENEFIEVTNEETYKIAKKRLSNLRTGRTSIQDQDKTIGTFFASIRKETIKITKSLIEITSSREEQIKNEVKRYEEIKAEKKRIKEEEEERKQQEIVQKSKDLEKDLKSIIDSFKNLKDKEDLENKFTDAVLKCDFEDHIEFKFLFDDVIEKSQEEFRLKEERIVSENKLQEGLLINEEKGNLLRVQQEINSIFEKINFENFKDQIQIINSKLNIEFETEVKNEFNLLKNAIESKVLNIEINIEKDTRKFEENRINVIKGATLDLIFQLNPENYETTCVLIEESIDQDSKSLHLSKVLFEEVKEDLRLKFETKKKEVEKDLKEYKIKKAKEIAEKEERKKALKNEISSDAFGFKDVISQTRNQIEENFKEESFQTTFVEGLKEDFLKEFDLLISKYNDKLKQ